MYRNFIQPLNQWKERNHKKPLIVKGARQIGKTFTIREFGKQFNGFHEFNFQKSNDLRLIFEETRDPQKIIPVLEQFGRKKINLKEDLIFFDEIQDCPQALTSLKYFYEDLPETFLISAGSLLGVYLNEASFPVGKVEFLNMFPMNFCEYLNANNQEMLEEVISSFDGSQTISESTHQLLKKELLLYYCVGGMPEVVNTYLRTDDLNQVRKKQEELLWAYQSDFAKYSGPINANTILTVFENIPKQLAKDNRKFQFNQIKEGARYTQFKNALDWLTHAGIAYKIPIIERAELPLKMHTQENCFKLYFFDVGLLGAMASVDPILLSQQNQVYKTFKGAFVENYFVEEFYSHSNHSLFCWQGRTSEVDFLYEHKGQLFPIEVKAGESGKLRSLGVFSEKYNTKNKIRSSLRPYENNQSANLKSIPLYFVKQIANL